jgi:Rieske Fe-S protein
MKQSRRDFLQNLLTATGVAVVASWFRPQSIWGAEEKPWLAVGKVEDYPLNVPTPVISAKTWPEGEKAKLSKVVIIRGESDVQARSSKCTHWGCEVKWEKGQYLCPCHGSVFNADGTVAKGPAKRPLEAMEAKIENGQILVRPLAS